MFLHVIIQPRGTFSVCFISYSSGIDKRNKNEIIILLASTEATLLYPIHTARRKATRQFCRFALRRAV